MTRQALLASTIIASSLALASATFAQTGKGASGAPAETVEEVVVTGVLSERSIEKAPISLTAVTEAQIEQQALTSAADLLKTVPGVFVNSAFGEIRSIVFSRGVSANSLDGASGYFYVSLQEDGLPVEPILQTNFGPDYFTRTDIMLRRLEALRGGTAAITGPNAPGGIFNYISKTGRSDPGTEVQAKVGLEGDGHNEFYRLDAYHGGELGPGLYYGVGGFYRHSVGARDPGFDRNRGGQIRGNLLWEYDQGSLLFTAKYLNDRNGFDEFIPATGFEDPKIASPYSNLTTTLPGPGDRSYTAYDGTTGVWNPRNVVHSRAADFGLNWAHHFSDRFQVENKLRFSHHESDWDVAALISASPLNNLATYLFTGTLGVPGAYTFRFPSGGLAAQVTSASGVDFNVAANNLPNQHILANGVQTLVGISSSFRDENWQDTLTLTGELGDHTVSVGVYAQKGFLDQSLATAGYALLSLQPKPQFLDITFTPTGSPLAFQVTNPSGFASNDFLGGAGAKGDQETVSLFAGDTWELTERLTLEGGLRYERIDYDISSVTTSRAPVAFLSAGPDGNPLTLYDNALPVPDTLTRTKRSFDFINFSGSASYQFSDELNAYVRFTRSKKAPSYQIIQSIDTPGEAATLFPKAQTIEQLELGLKYVRPGLSLQAFPFYSKLSNVADFQTFYDENGTAYSPPPVFGQIETYGVEVQANADLSDKFNLYAALTLQNPKSSRFSTYIGNLPTRTDDQLVTIPKGDADNNPKIIARATGTYRPTEKLSLFATYSYLGKRAANRLNAFYLPGFSTVDIGAAYQVNDRVRLQANVNNLFDNYGIMSYSRSGSLLASLDRQALTPQDVAAAGPNGLIQVLPSQPRAFFVTATVEF